ncbi:FUN14 domain-containing protein [Halobaculum sp. MBLA0143]|uniref:FUN14 domain-containing protein n=1 Tax=Halobaculum sp. MBLA0143 TaxID=3079933 RepID=UPI0035234DA9
MADGTLLQFALDPQQLGLELGTGAAIGGITGFAAKKIAKLIAVLVGLEVALFKFLESRGFVTVNWEKFGSFAQGLAKDGGATGAESVPFLNTILSTLSVSAGFTGGFMVGFRKG